MTVVRDRKIRTVPRTNQIVGFVTVRTWKKMMVLIFLKWFLFLGSLVLPTPSLLSKKITSENSGEIVPLWDVPLHFICFSWFNYYFFYAFMYYLSIVLDLDWFITLLIDWFIDWIVYLFFLCPHSTLSQKLFSCNLAISLAQDVGETKRQQCPHLCAWGNSL